MLKDQKDLLRAFNDHGVEYLVVGGHAVGFHSEPRGTKDLDVWIRSDPANAKAVFNALRDFGAPLSGVSPDDFNEHPETVFQVGLPPHVSMYCKVFQVLSLKMHGNIAWIAWQRLTLRFM